jgi:hypothetical protein
MLAKFLRPRQETHFIVDEQVLWKIGFTECEGHVESVESKYRVSRIRRLDFDSLRLMSS